MARSGVINAMTKDELAKVLHTTPQKSDDTAAAQTIIIPAFVTANLSADSVSNTVVTVSPSLQQLGCVSHAVVMVCVAASLPRPRWALRRRVVAAADGLSGAAAQRDPRRALQAGLRRERRHAQDRDR